MASETGISWTDKTFNPIMGCTKVSPGCANCYAERDFDHRYQKVKWGPSGTRVLTTDANWRKPLQWDKQAQIEQEIWCCVSFHPMTGEIVGDALARHGSQVDTIIKKMIERGSIEESSYLLYPNELHRPRVFCASLADIFEDWEGPILDNNGWALRIGNDDPSQVYKMPPDSSVTANIAGRICELSRSMTMEDVRARLFTLIDDTPHLDWQLLTKRPENIERMWPYAGVVEKRPSIGVGHYRPNVWLGTTVENQEYADKRIPELLKCHDIAPVLFLSCEPLLGPVEFSNVTKRSDAVAQLGRKALSGINWVIVGCESGSKRRETNLEWVRSIRDQCKAAGVPFFVKQLEIDGKVSTDVTTFPEDLQIQEFPC